MTLNLRSSNWYVYMNGNFTYCYGKPKLNKIKYFMNEFLCVQMHIFKTIYQDVYQRFRNRG